MSNSKLKMIGAVGAVLIVVLGILIGGGFRQQNPNGSGVKDDQQSGDSAKSLDGASQSSDQELAEGFKLIGGIARPKSDMAERARRDGPGYRNMTEALGEIKRIPLDSNAYTKSVAEARKDGEKPERLSSLIDPPPFDEAAFTREPQKYLDTIEPGRIWQTEEAGQADPIKRLGAYSQKVLRGETVTLRIQVEPGAPVNFYSQKLGSFSNQLTSMTVQADDQGIAEVEFTASDRARGLITVLASSPKHSHQARFLVQVELPDEIPRLDAR